MKIFPFAKKASLGLSGSHEHTAPAYTGSSGWCHPDLSPVRQMLSSFMGPQMQMKSVMLPVT